MFIPDPELFSIPEPNLSRIPDPDPQHCLYAPKLNENVQLHLDENPRDERRRSTANNQKTNFENI
jgi:hypothetical protein